MELWDIYDRDRCLKEGSMRRGEPIKKGDYHLVVHVCVFGSDGRMLIQKRQPFKEDFSGMWDVTVGGSAVKGDNSRMAAERELAEEVGVHIDFSDIHPSLTVNFEDGFDDIYLVNKDVDISSLSLQYEEVERVAWATEEEILAMIEKGAFIPYYPQFISLLFAMRFHLGAHSIRTPISFKK